MTAERQAEGWMEHITILNQRAVQLQEERARLREENERLRAALEPFARADRAIGHEPGPFRFETMTGYRYIKREHLRAASAALAYSSDGGVEGHAGMRPADKPEMAPIAGVEPGSSDLLYLPGPYEAPFSAHGSSVLDAKERYVAECSSPFGPDVRDDVVRLIASALNAFCFPAVAQTAPKPNVDRVARAIHEALGGNGWAYSYYGGDEWKDKQGLLISAALAAIRASTLPSTSRGSE